jgi:hypothetical protein
VKWIASLWHRRRWLRSPDQRKVSWDACVYSPTIAKKKAAEDAFVKMMVDHRMAMVRIQMQASMAQWEAEMAEQDRKYRSLFPVAQPKEIR